MPVIRARERCRQNPEDNKTKHFRHLRGPQNFILFALVRLYGRFKYFSYSLECLFDKSTSLPLIYSALICVGVSKGSPVVSIKSAHFPFSTDPILSPAPQISASLIVIAFNSSS